MLSDYYYSIFISFLQIMNNMFLILLANSKSSTTLFGTKTSNTINKTIDTANNTAGFLVDNPFISKLLSVLLAIAVAGFLIWISKLIANFISNKVKRNFNEKDTDSVTKIAQLSGDLVFYSMATFSVYLGFKIV